jgi:hypothetical protein
LVKDLDVLSVFNGTFAVSKQGPKSAEYNLNGNKDYKAQGSNKNEVVISKSKQIGVYVKHMVSEIMLLIAQNKDLVPYLVINNSISFLLDLRTSILSETSKDHELAVESEINIAQTVAKIFIVTNPILIHDHMKYDAIKLICRRLLSTESHHELLIYEALLSLTNISSCLQGKEDFADEIARLECGPKNLY